MVRFLLIVFFLIFTSNIYANDLVEGPWDTWYKLSEDEYGVQWSVIPSGLFGKTRLDWLIFVDTETDERVGLYMTRTVCNNGNIAIYVAEPKDDVAEGRDCNSHKASGYMVKIALAESPELPAKALELLNR